MGGVRRGWLSWRGGLAAGGREGSCVSGGLFRELRCIDVLSRCGRSCSGLVFDMAGSFAGDS